MIIGNAPSPVISVFRLVGFSDQDSAKAVAALRSLVLELMAIEPPTENGTTTEPSSVGQGKTPMLFHSLFGMEPRYQLPIGYIAALPALKLVIESA